MIRRYLEGWAHRIDNTLEQADHTYVYCPSKKKYFDCWGGHSGPVNRKIVSGKGYYEVADRYRMPVGNWKDTAGIGVYSVDGVCHQATNCFLYSTNPRQTLDLNVHGYWLSVVAFGVYGKNFLVWKLAVYDPCYKKAVEASKAQAAVSPAAADFTALLDEMYETNLQPEVTIDISEIVVRETALAANWLAPGIQADAFAGLQRSLLQEVDLVVQADVRGQELANKVNSLSAEFQTSLAGSITEEEYTRLTGVKPGFIVKIVDPVIAAATHQ